LRLDAHQYFTPEHTPEHLEAILKRNKFDGSIAIARDEEETRLLLDLTVCHESIRGVVGCGEIEHPKLVGQLRHEVHDAAQALRLSDEEPGRRIAILRLGSPPVGGAGSDAWANAMEQAAQRPGVFCKASGLLSLAPKPWKADALRPYIGHVLRVFGPRRVMFGSDWPACLPDSIWKETLAIFTQAIGAQSTEVREELLGGTAQRFYGIRGS
jgi:L-fuconolactonase